MYANKEKGMYIAMTAEEIAKYKFTDKEVFAIFVKAVEKMKKRMPELPGIHQPYFVFGVVCMMSRRVGADPNTPHKEIGINREWGYTEDGQKVNERSEAESIVYESLKRLKKHGLIEEVFHKTMKPSPINRFDKPFPCKFLRLSEKGKAIAKKYGLI